MAGSEYLGCQVLAWEISLAGSNSLCFLSRQLPGAKETRFCPLQPCHPPYGTNRTINIFDLWGVQFYWGKILLNANLKKWFDDEKVRKINSILLIWSLVGCGLVLAFLNSSQTYARRKSLLPTTVAFLWHFSIVLEARWVEISAAVIYKAIWNRLGSKFSHQVRTFLDTPRGLKAMTEDHCAAIWVPHGMPSILSAWLPLQPPEALGPLQLTSPCSPSLLVTKGVATGLWD